jgi:acyltransferase-like protein
MMMLGIVLHGGQMYMTMELGFDYYRDPVSSPVMDGILIFINTFRMPVFFVLSGFFTAMLFQRYQLAGMLKNRWQRIALPMLVFLPPLSLVLSLQWIIATNLSKTGAIGLDTSLLDYPYLLWNNTHHLWFLYYLMIMLAIISLAIIVLQHSPAAIRQQLSRLLQRLPTDNSWLIVLTGLVFGLMANHRVVGRLSGNIIWQPYWPSVAFFGLCLLIGWGLYYRQQSLQVFARRGWLYLAAAHIFLAIALAAFLTQGDPTSENYPILHPLLSLTNGVSVSFFIAGWIGIFYRYCNQFNPWTRYFSDAAYWIFLLHQPVLLLCAIPLYGWQVIAEVKFLVVCISTMLICTLSYHYWVRNTAIGVLLNGRRYPRTLP